MSLMIKNAVLQGVCQDVFIQDAFFSAIGPSLDMEADQTIDAAGMAVLPGLANSHTHAAMTLLRGYADDMELYTWLSKYIWPFESKLKEEDVYAGVLLACLEMIKSGTTFFADMYWHLPATVRAVSEMGLRAGLSAVFLDFGDQGKGRDFREQAENALEDSASWPEHISFCLGPHAVYTVSGASLKWIRDFARANGLKIHIHMSETEREVQDCIRDHGCRPFEYLDTLGLLGPDVIAAHAVWVDSAERKLLADSGVHVAHCPVSNMKLCSGAFHYRRMLSGGVPVALGTDGCSSNNNLDMFEEMKFAALRAKYQADDPAALPAPRIFESATGMGYRAFGLNGGRIEVGALADCILVDLDHPALVPGHNLISDLVYSANGDCVDTTICNGRILMRHRIVDREKEIIELVRARVKALTS